MASPSAFDAALCTSVARAIFSDVDSPTSSSSWTSKTVTFAFALTLGTAFEVAFPVAARVAVVLVVFEIDFEGSVASGTGRNRSCRYATVVFEQVEGVDTACLIRSARACGGNAVTAIEIYTLVCRLEDSMPYQSAFNAFPISSLAFGKQNPK